MTSARRPGTPAAERKRLQRQRERESTLLYQTEDWQLFLDPATLPQKAGCQPGDLRKIVLKELVDNGLDAGASVHLYYRDGSWVVADDGPGLDPADVPRLFAVNRPLTSSKLRRLPLRGMLGNGLRVVTGAVAATSGSLAVVTRGHRLVLAVCPATGKSLIVSDTRAPPEPGLSVFISLGGSTPTDSLLAHATLVAAKHGQNYVGPSSPWWYGVGDIHRLFLQVTPPETTVGNVCRSLGLTFDDDRLAGSLSRDDASAVLQRLRAEAKPVPPERLGFIGAAFQQDCPGYARKNGVIRTQAGAQIPYVVEAWAACTPPPHKGQGSADIELLLNRSLTVATIFADSRPGAIVLEGCDLQRQVKGPATGVYEIWLSVIAPHVQLCSDGKEPSLAPFGEAIADVLRKACGMAHRAMARPAKGSTIKDAAWAVMETAYLTASGNGQYPAHARQIMYAARPEILERTGAAGLSDKYFTGTLLPDYIAAHGKADWDVVFDDRGAFTEPHTNHAVGLGTVAVRSYLSDHGPIGPAVAVTCDTLYPTHGPQHRYATVLFVEKEGFHDLLKVARIAERFDVAIMSTKGTSVTAARALLDRLAPHIDKVLVLHDFDVAGFSIFGTLGSTNRRYTFKSNLRLTDIGLRLADVMALNLQSEPVETTGGWNSRASTLRRHGATAEEITFLKTRRVELNALSSDLFVSFVEKKLSEHGVRKVVPNRATLELHARRVIEQDLGEALFRDNQASLQAEAAATALPADLDSQVRAILCRHPEAPWDQAVAAVVRAARSAA